MPPFVPYRIAKFRPDRDWEESPYESRKVKMLGRLRILTKSYRHREERASVQLFTINHPRIVNPELDESVETLFQNLVWLQRLGTRPQPITRTFAGTQATGSTYVVDALASGGLIGDLLGSVISKRIRVAEFTWRRDGMSDFAYVASANEEVAGLVLDEAPRLVEYDEIRFPWFIL